jgi:hypothetical protein
MVISDVSDSEILISVKSWGTRCPTYVVRNTLSMDFGHRSITTAQVLRRLKKLEKEGKVVRMKSPYKVMLCWGVVEATL